MNSNTAPSIFNDAQPDFAAFRHYVKGSGFRWLVFQNPVEYLCGYDTKDVLPMLQRIQEAVNSGFYAAGFLSYEAASAFDSALAVHQPTDTPLLWFGIYNQPEYFEHLPLEPETVSSDPSLHGLPEISRTQYNEGLRQIHEYIGSGDCYQVNYTYRMQQQFSGSLSRLFPRIADHCIGVDMDTREPCGGYAAYIQTEDSTICSVSPELFFSLKKDRIICRPMKGTAPRGRYNEEDILLANNLKESPKNRAENIMIVDMVRNDLGRICEPGSIKASPLFQIEKYPSLFQMTSTVQGTTEAELPDIFKALFPSASITGTPKVRAMQIIKEVEASPRGVYTGTAGFIGPDRQAQFNVAIRTLVYNHKTRMISCGSGGGIVWDSRPESEYDESRLKTEWLVPLDGEPFQLLESMRWHPRRGCFLLDEHLNRLSRAADYFDYRFDPDKILKALHKKSATLTSVTHKIRLLLNRDGDITIETCELKSTDTGSSWRVCLAPDPIDNSNPYIFNKTTNRSIYNQFLDQHPDMDDIILWNKHGEVTESCLANVVIHKNDKWITPPLSAGLLGGTYRAYLIKKNIIHEQPINIEDFKKAKRRFLINSVRRRIKFKLISSSQK